MPAPRGLTNGGSYRQGGSGALVPANGRSYRQGGSDALVPANGGSYRQGGAGPGKSPAGTIVPHGGTAGGGAGNTLAMLQLASETAKPEGAFLPQVVATADERRAEERMANRLECRNMCVFVAFLIVFTAGMLLEGVPASSRLADRIQMRLQGRGPDLNMLEHTDELYDYLEQVIIPGLYENNSDTDIADELSPMFHPIDMYNRMLGGVRVRQSRVQYVSGCEMGPLFSEYTIQCYPSFSSATEMTAPFGPDLIFQWQTDPKGTSYVGTLGTYSADGYIEVLPANLQGAVAKVKQLRDGQFFGPWTRAVFVDFVVWSMNVGTYIVATISIEISASEGIASHTSILAVNARSLRPGGLGTSQEVISFILIIIVLMLFVFYFMFEEAMEVRRSPSIYFMDGWNVMDWVVLILIVVCFCMRLFAFTEASKLNLGDEQILDRDAFPSIRSFAQLVDTINLIDAICAVLIYAKCAKYLRRIPIIRDLLMAVWKALDLFIPFAVMLLLLFLGFAMAYNIGFGDTILELSTYGSALTYLCRSFVRDGDLMQAYHVTQGYGAALILLFYVVFLLVGVNVLFAVIADALFRSAHEVKDENEPEERELGTEPIEECVRELRFLLRRFLKRRFPALYKRLFKRRKPKWAFAEQSLRAAGDARDDGQEVLPDNVDSEDDWWDEGASSSQGNLHGPPRKAELMRAIEQMSGRILSEVSIVGIEIRSELHDVCERVAQMQMAVEELSMRADAVRLDQEEYLEDRNG